MVHDTFQSLDSATGILDSWIKDCPTFAGDEAFLRFRSHPTMLLSVEGTPIRAGRWHLRRLLQNPLFRSLIDIFFATSDTVGSPQNLIKVTSQGKTVEMNPTTLRYVNNSMNLRK